MGTKLTMEADFYKKPFMSKGISIVVPLEEEQQLIHHKLFSEKERFMSEFKDVTIIKKANIYFDGKVTSRSVIFPDGSRKTLGIMLPGEYEFNTNDK